MIDTFTNNVLKSLPLAFDYAAGLHPEVDTIVARLIDDDYSVFIHYWPESTFDSIPVIKDQARRGWNQDGIVLRVSNPDSYHLMNTFPRRVGVNLDDCDVVEITHYQHLDKVLCKHDELVATLRMRGIRAELLSYDAILTTLCELLPPFMQNVNTQSATISVIIPTANRPQHLAHALRELRNQQIVTQVEIIVVDNGSDEENCTLNQSACTQYRAIYERLPGEAASDVAHAKNHGLSRASGNYFVMLDDDTIVSPWHLLNILPVLAAPQDRTIAVAPRQPTKAVASQLTWADNCCETVLPSPYAQTAERFAVIEERDRTCHGNIAFHRSLYASGMRYLEGLGSLMEVRELHCRLCDNGYRFVEMRMCSCLHLPHARPVFDTSDFLEREKRFLRLHPHRLLDNQFQIALNRRDDGRVSVITPIQTGAPRRLDRFLRMLKKQNYRGEIEILICDDCSSKPEQLEADCARYGARYIRVEPLRRREHACHSGGARNSGLAAATGDYIQFLDQDTFLVPHHIQNCVNILAYQTNQVCLHAKCGPLGDLAMLDEVTAYSRFHLTIDRLMHLLECVNTAEPLPLSRIDGECRWIHSNNLFLSRMATDRVGTFDESSLGYGEEVYDYTYRLYHAGIRFARMEGLPAFQIEMPKQMIQDRNPLHATSILRLICKYPEAREFRPGAMEWAVNIIDDYLRLNQN